MKFVNKIGYLLAEGFRSIFTHGFMSFASVTIIIACLIIMGSFSLLAVNINEIIQNLERENEMLAFVGEEFSEREARDIEPNIRAIPNVSSVNFVTREEAMESFKDEYDNQSLFNEIEPGVFRHRYVIYLDDIGLIEDTQQRLLSTDGIADVSAQHEIARGLVMVRNIVSAVSLVLIVILFVVSIFIMSNTIKLTTFNRREEIAIMKMVGATNSFIRMPFVVEGLVLGIIGAGLALAIQWGIYSFITEQLMASIADSGLISVLTFTGLAVPAAVVFLAVGVTVGAFGGSIAIRNYLKV